MAPIESPRCSHQAPGGDGSSCLVVGASTCVRGLCVVGGGRLVCLGATKNVTRPVANNISPRTNSDAPTAFGRPPHVVSISKIAQKIAGEEITGCGRNRTPSANSWSAGETRTWSDAFGLVYCASKGWSWRHQLSPPPSKSDNENSRTRRHETSHTSGWRTREGGNNSRRR